MIKPQVFKDEFESISEILSEFTKYKDGFVHVLDDYSRIVKEQTSGIKDGKVFIGQMGSSDVGTFDDFTDAVVEMFKSLRGGVISMHGLTELLTELHDKGVIREDTTNPTDETIH